jgi:hypothetical protein
MAFISTLSPTTPTDGQPVSTGAPKLREIVIALQDSFPNMDAAMTAAGKVLLIAANAAAQRTALELGNSVTLDTGTDIGDLVVLADIGAEAKIARALLDIYADASVADVRAAVAERIFTPDLIEAASAYVSLGSNTIALNWDAGINFQRTLTGNGTISNPTNGQPGTYRVLRVLGDSGTARSILDTSYGSQFGGALPSLTDITNTKHYEITIKCITSSHFYVVGIADASPP